MLGGGGLYRGWNPHPKINEDQERNLPQHYVQLKDRTGPGGAEKKEHALETGNQWQE
jgi:hypothetical protein